MQPHISILIAVRNESAVILRCLQALQALTYPTSCLQILIGNDASTDNTQELITNFIAGKPQFELYEIQEKVGKQAGKANVLAQLAQKATGEYWLVTDADVAVSPNWIQDCLQSFDTSEVGVASHFTWIEVQDIFSACQALEWTNALATFGLLAQWNIGVTAQGNNMALKKEAYQAIGGYEALPFSVTEDFQLFWAILQKGYTFRNKVHQKGLVTSLPAPTWHSLWRQRRRWLAGALELGWLWQLILWGRAFFLPLLGILFVFLPIVAISILAAMWVGNFTTLFIALYRVGKVHYMWYFPFFLLYQEIVLLGTAFYFFGQKRIKWKGREF